MLKDLAKKNRSYRRFYEDKKITREQLVDIIDCARYAACGNNRQVLRFLPVCNKEDNEKMFKSLRWAALLTEWDGPGQGERPAAYVVILCKTDAAAKAAWDEGIAAQTMLLAAAEQGLGGCMLANVDRETVRADFNIGADYAVKLVLALGVPKEEIVIDDISAGEDTGYYRDENQVHHVPKIRTEDLIY